MKTTTILMILSDGTHRTTKWDTVAPHAAIARAVREQSRSADRVIGLYLLTVILAIGDQVTHYEGGEIDSVFLTTDQEPKV